ncbi:unnamed protein product, partial [Scytosiphon promiscuus]
ARHHRILRSAPGSCWAVVNAGRNNLGGGGGGAAMTSPSQAWNGPLSSCRDRERNLDGYGTLSWSSTTAVGGNGSGPPPRSIGGAPTGHLGPPLLEARRWAEGGDGRGAVRRERERLALLLAREQRLARSSACAAAAAEVEPLQPPLSAGNASVSDACGDEGRAAPTAAAAQGGGGDSADREPAEREMQGPRVGGRAARRCGSTYDVVVGFVSSFSAVPYPSFSLWVGKDEQGVNRTRDSVDGSLWLKIDTGERVVSAVLPPGSLRQLLGLTLRRGDGGQSSATVRATGPESRLQEGSADKGGGEGGPGSLPAPVESAADGLLARATTVLGCDEGGRCKEDATGTRAFDSERESGNALSPTT